MAAWDAVAVNDSPLPWVFVGTVVTLMVTFFILIVWKGIEGVQSEAANTHCSRKRNAWFVAAADGRPVADWHRLVYRPAHETRRG